MKSFCLLVGFVTCFGASIASGHSLPNQMNKSGRFISPSRDLANFTLPSHRGKKVSLKGHKGKQIVFFGFTTCKEVCPVGLAYIGSELKAAGKAAEDVRVLFLTVDPENDSMSRMKTYLQNFHPNILGLRGTREQTEAIAADFGTPMGKKGQEVMHGSWFYLVDEAGKWKALYRLPLAKGALAKDLKKLAAS